MTSKVSPEEFCRAFEAWARVCMTPLESDEPGKREDRAKFAEHWQYIQLKIRKSCLLKRLIYGGETLRTRPCPVHKGRWSGIQWPGPERCECAKGCGCTTGWLLNEPTTEEGTPVNAGATPLQMGATESA